MNVEGAYQGGMGSDADGDGVGLHVRQAIMNEDQKDYNNTPLVLPEDSGTTTEFGFLLL